MRDRVPSALLSTNRSDKYRLSNTVRQQAHCILDSLYRFLYFLLVKRLFLPSVLLLFIFLQSALAESHSVGFRIKEISDPVTEVSTLVGLWYPTQETGKLQQIGPLQLQVSLNAEAINTRSLIIISHGFSGSMYGHHDFALYLAKNGYFVATPTHPDLAGLKSERVELDPLVLRPRQIGLIVNALQGEKKNIRSVGIVGYSLGAYSALVSMGATPHFNYLDEYCSVQSNDELLCAPLTRQRLSIVEKQFKSVQDNQIEFKAAVLLAPGYGPLFNRQSFSRISVPIRIFSAEHDEELDKKYHAEHLTKLLGQKVEHESIKGAGHYTFMAPCTDVLKKRLPAFLCVDRKGIDRQAIHQQLNNKIHSFFEEAL